MSRTSERFQNPVPGDTVNLRLISYNSNNYANLTTVTSVGIYTLGCGSTECSPGGPPGSKLLTTIPGASVTQVDIGSYLLPLETYAPFYTIGKYSDVWNVIFSAGDVPTSITNNFQLYSDLWYTTVIPAVYSFDFRFQPNRIRIGSKKWLIIQIIPNVPRATDLERYYTNLAISADLSITIEKNCGPCVPEEHDLRIVVDAAPVEVREKVFGYYFLDTTDMDCGLYDVWFSLNFAGSIDISAKQQLQLF